MPDSDSVYPVYLYNEEKNSKEVILGSFYKSTKILNFVYFYAFSEAALVHFVSPSISFSDFRFIELKVGTLKFLDTLNSNLTSVFRYVSCMKHLLPRCCKTYRYYKIYWKMKKMQCRFNRQTIFILTSNQSEPATLVFNLELKNIISIFNFISKKSKNQ